MTSSSSPEQRDNPDAIPKFLTSSFVWTFFGVACILPLAWILTSLFTSTTAWTELAPLAFHLRLLARTLFFNSIVALLAVLLAWPVAVVIGAGRGFLSRAITFLLPAALLIPSIVYAYGWMQVLRVCNGWMLDHHFASIYPVPSSPTDIARCIWTLATWLWPIPAAIIGLSLRRLDADLQQQALLEGAYWRIVLRQLLGPIIAAFAIVLVLAMQEFAVYEPTGISVVATEVRTVFETGQIGLNTGNIANVQTGSFATFPVADQKKNAAAAIVTGLPLMAVVALLSFIAARVFAKQSTTDTIDIGPKPRILTARAPVILLALFVITLTFLLPMGTMIGSIHRPFSPSRIWRTFSPQVVGTLTIGAIVALTAIAIAACATIRRFTAPVVLGLLTFLTGGQLLAIALVRLYNHPVFSDGWLSFVYNGPGVVVMAYLARFAWLAAWAGRWTFTSRWKALREMAAVDGAGAIAVARFVIWPVVWPLVAASGVLVMLLSMTEVPATVLLNPLRPQVLIPQLMSWVHTLRTDDMLEGSLLLAGVVIILAAVVVGLVAMTRRRAIRLGRSLALPVFAVLLLIAGCKDGGKPDEIWLETGAGEGQTVYPRAICYSKIDDTFYVCDRLARIQHLDRHGKFLNGWRMPEWTNGKPVGLSVDPDGNLWVPDTHYSRVIVFNPKGEIIKQFGKYGMGPGEFVWVSDIAFDSTGKIFVSEFGDHDRIQVFDQNLKYLYEFGKFGSGDGEFSRPQAMVIDGDTMYISDACNHRISVWKTDGRFLRNMGRIGSALGELRFPYGLDMDSKGRLVVCEFGNNRVQLIDKDSGQGLAIWGAAGREPGQLAYPWGVAVDKKDRVVAVDAGNNRLQVFGF